MTEYEAYTPDVHRQRRLGFDEAVLCGSKSVRDIAAILAEADARGATLLLTRLDAGTLQALPDGLPQRLDYDPVSRTAYFGAVAAPRHHGRVGVVTAGTSDLPVAREAVRTLRYHGESALEVHDVGVAGLWRLLERVEALAELPVLIVAAGMDAALPSVIGGLVPGAVVAVPTSAGYGVAAGGETALRSMLSSCAPGVAVVNIDNGYGAACAALRVLGVERRRGQRG